VEPGVWLAAATEDCFRAFYLYCSIFGFSRHPRVLSFMYFCMTVGFFYAFESILINLLLMKRGGPLRFTASQKNKNKIK